MSVVVHADQVSKIFRLGDVGSSTLTDDIRAAYYKILGRENPYVKMAVENDRTSGVSSDYVWALKDINFEVNQGEIVGLVGRNGAGKSTLLKILSRTTTPTQGEIKIKGKVASLLEVGTGFHPDLSGRENIYLNGTILGMRRSEIRAKFNDIVEFAGVQRYIDTPVKRYSSGMYVRLAFAVAAHLDPDILIIDEVLAVGDAEFQAKCLGKMKDVSNQGRTVIFVSHNMGAVSDLCSRAILIKQGGIVLDSNTDNVIREYVQMNMKLKLNDSNALSDSTVRRGIGAVRFSSIITSHIGGEETNEFLPGDSVRFNMQCTLMDDVKELYVNIAFRSGRTRDIVTSTGKVKLDLLNKKAGDSISFSIDLPKIALRPGVYETYYWLGDSRAESPFDVVDNLMPPLIINTPLGINPMMISGYIDIPFSFNQSEI